MVNSWGPYALRFQINRRQLTASVVLFASAALAAGMERQGESGDWTILIDPEKGNGRFTWKPFEGVMTVENCVAPNQAGGFFAAYKPT